MNIQTMTLFTPSVSKVAFALACGLIVGAGWETKLAFDEIGSIQDQISDDLYQPAPHYRWEEWRRTNSAALQPPPAPVGILPFPTNPAVPVLE
jgi:hypothetical protein